MKLKELLKSFKKALQNEEINEFDAQFEDHPIKNGDIILKNLPIDNVTCAKLPIILYTIITHTANKNQ